MTQKMEGRVFLICHRGGVTAITPLDYSEETAELVERLCDYYDSQEFTVMERASANSAVLQVVFRKPIFTFARSGRAKESPWFTGDHDLLGILHNYILEQGGEVRDGDFYVPFCNEHELRIYDTKALQDELRWITTNAQFLEEFGISREELLTRVVTA